MLNIHIFNTCGSEFTARAASFDSRSFSTTPRCFCFQSLAAFYVFEYLRFHTADRRQRLAHGHAFSAFHPGPPNTAVERTALGGGSFPYAAAFAPVTAAAEQTRRPAGSRRASHARCCSGASSVRPELSLTFHSLGVPARLP